MSLWKKTKMKKNSINKHQCDYCCWLNPVYNECECPYNWREKACEGARERKKREEGDLEN